METAPDPIIDVSDFQFKLHSRLKVFKEANTFSKGNFSLIASASRFGLIFVGSTSSCFEVLLTSNVEEHQNKHETSDFLRRTVQLPSNPTFLSVNCDCTQLCVIVVKGSLPIAIFYDVVSFYKQNPTKISEIRLSANPNVSVVDCSWNPTIPNMIAICKSDKSTALYEFKPTGIDINEIPPIAGCTSLSWSPRGKQLAVGSADGKIIHYKPDLKAVKMIEAPPLPELKSVVSLLWVSNSQFVAVYCTGSGCTLVVVDSPKGENTKYINYEDICFSYGNARSAQFYLIHQPTWKVIIVASSNSMEVGVLGYTDNTWKQWLMLDEARAELPLGPNRQEVWPVGLSLDISTTKPLVCGESEESAPPTPLLYLLSHTGQMCCFRVVNVRENAAQICQQPERVPDVSGIRLFCKETGAESKPEVQKVASESINQTPTQKIENLSGSQPVAFTGKPMQLPDLKQSVATPQTVLRQPEKPQPIAVVPRTMASATRRPVAQKTETKTAEPTSESNNTNLDYSEETQKMLAKMVKEECQLLQSELKAILHKAKAVNVTVGSENDATQLVKSISLIQNFLEEVNDTSNAQAAEVHYLKQQLIQTWGWFEEARSRFAILKDETMACLLRAQPLDPASRHHLDNINHSIYYLESQLTEANNALDEQWENFQNTCKKTLKVQVPTLEKIYQSMVRQNAILQKQIYKMKDIATRMQTLSRSNNFSTSALSLKTSEIEKKFSNLQIENQPKNLFDIEYERVLYKENQLNDSKTSKLKGMLKNYKVAHISVSKPFIPPPDVTLKQIEPIVKTQPTQTNIKTEEKQPSTFNFLHSTPKPTVPVAKFDPEEKVKSIQTTVPSVVSSNKPIESAFVTPVQTAANGKKFLFAETPRSTTTLSFVPKTAPIEFAAMKSATPQTSGFAFSSSNTPATTSMFTFQSATTVESNKPKTTTEVAKTTNVSSSLTFSWGNNTNTSPFTSLIKKETSSPVVAEDLTKPPEAPSTFPKATEPQPTKTEPEKTTKPTTTLPTKSEPTFAAIKPQTTSPFAVTSISSTTLFNQPLFNAATTKPESSPKTTTQPVMTTTTPKASEVVATSSTPSTSNLLQSGLFSTKATNLFGSPSTGSIFPTSSTEVVKPTVSVSKSIFSGSGLESTATTSQGSGTNIFGTPPALSTAKTTATAPAFGASSFTSAFSSTQPTTTSATIFGQQTPFAAGSVFQTTPTPSTASTVFGQPTPTPSTASTIFGQSTPTPSTVFGQPTSTPSTASTVFGQSTPTPSTASTVFGQPTPTPSTASTVFGQPTPTSSTVFGQPISTPSTASTVFGQSTPTPSTASTIFGQPILTPSTASNVFGQPATTQSTAPSIFAQSTPTPSTTSNVFGQPATKPSTIFGQPPPTTSNIFGQPISTSSVTSSIFGQQAKTPSTASNVFGQPIATPSTASNVFGQPTPAPSNVFGQPISTTSTPFFASGSSIFSKPATAAPSQFSFANATATTTAPSAFGLFGSLNVSGNTASSGGFGAEQQNPFQKVAEKPTGGALGSTGGSLFGSSNAGSSTKSIFGVGGGNGDYVFGGSTAFGGGSSSTFGAAPAFGQTSAFGQSTFGSSEGAKSPFGSSFSGGNQSVAQAGFGAVTAASSSPFGGSGGGFGGPPVFGSAVQPAFGASPTFGGQPAFGSTPAFGAMTSQSSFASPVQQQNPSFANLANQNTLGFGSLAQQTQSPKTSNEFGNSSSFSTWR